MQSFRRGRIRQVMNQRDGPSRFQPTILENACLGWGSVVGKLRSRKSTSSTAEQAENFNEQEDIRKQEEKSDRVKQMRL